MTKAGRADGASIRTPDGGASASQYLAGLLALAVAVGVLVASGVPGVVQARTRDAICEVVQQEGCAGTGAADEPGATYEGDAPDAGTGEPADPGEEEEPGSADAVPEGSQPAAVLTPELMGRYQRCEQPVPSGFAARMGYTPACVEAGTGRRAVRPDGECSAPIIGNSGRSFDFTVPCRSHDFGYDLLRYYAGVGTAHDPDSRRAADRLFREDMFAHCEATRSGFDEWSCNNWARIYSSAVNWVSRLQGHRVP